MSNRPRTPTRLQPPTSRLPHVLVIALWLCGHGKGDGLFQFYAQALERDRRAGLEAYWRPRTTSLEELEAAIAKALTDDAAREEWERKLREENRKRSESRAFGWLGSRDDGASVGTVAGEVDRFTCPPVDQPLRLRYQSALPRPRA